jgi:hypothetical protein
MSDNIPDDILKRRFRIRFITLLLFLITLLLLGFIAIALTFVVQDHPPNRIYQETVNSIYATNTSVKLAIEATNTARVVQTQTAQSGK